MTACRRSPVAPKGRFWLGRLAPEIVVQNSRLGERSERLEPCEVGVRRPSVGGRRPARSCSARLVVWGEFDGGDETRMPTGGGRPSPIEVTVTLPTPASSGTSTLRRARRVRSGARSRRRRRDDLRVPRRARAREGRPRAGRDPRQRLAGGARWLGHKRVRGEPAGRRGRHPAVHPGQSARLLSLRPHRPCVWRERRRRAASRPACSPPPTLRVHDQPRPIYWDPDAGTVSRRDVHHARRASAPVPAGPRRRRGPVGCRTLVRRRSRPPRSRRALGRRDARTGRSRSEPCSSTRWPGSATASDLLETDERAAARLRPRQPSLRDVTRRAAHSSGARSSSASCSPTSRPSSTSRPTAHAAVVDTLWFATGRRQDRDLPPLRPHRGVLRSPARQARGHHLVGPLPAAHALAPADPALRGRARSRGAAYGGTKRSAVSPSPSDSSSATTGHRTGSPPSETIGRANRIRRTPTCPAATRSCCAARSAPRSELEMRFDPTRWALDHVCTRAGCPWGGQPLPFRIVDEEIYRSLPTVVLGTLDKAANISMQAAMRGFYGPPAGRCTVRGHGYTYAPRSRTPAGCLFPGCSAQVGPLAQDATLYAPTVRMQDELHLLRDSLGAVDAHYESLLDELQRHYGPPPKIIASSATLAGHDEQVAALYRRDGRTFPRPGPRVGHSIWSRDTDELARSVRWPGPARCDPGVRDRPVDRSAPAGHAPRRRGSRRGGGRDRLSTPASSLASSPPTASTSSTDRT